MRVKSAADCIRELEKNDWKIVNQTSLPVVCFTDAKESGGNLANYFDAIARDVVSSGEVWISTTRLAPDVPVLRACITNYKTEESDVKALVASLNKARQKLSGQRS